ncbi:MULTISPECIES: DNA polymerase IV [unclassified Leucobacter]|uniref:DNA polymerase IV n=1 Tax=unclassified Leucobacter TaxID=2621730 RepID=UPI00165D4726|nr:MULTISPECIES: DNA polymerase IV [unclassified Leucobacter]MBC9935471.1 DNA polymerase IV [Leucobacter sp. cx-87]
MSSLPRTRASMLHVDMDSFFVSVELLDRPDLIGKPVVVGGTSGRSVVSSASYEARTFGVRSAMPIGQALARCPQLVILPGSYDKYRIASRAVMAIFAEFTPLVEPLSIDEAFLDVEGSRKLFGEPIEIARAIRERVREVTGLPASVGLGGTKFIAKLASQRAKPDGILEIPPARSLEFLHPLPVGAMWGVGAATEKALRSRAIHTVADLAREPMESLRRLVGAASAQKLHELANGRDARDIVTSRIEKSIGHEETFAQDVADPRVLNRELLRLSAKIGERLRAAEVEARTVAIKVRWANFETITRSRTLPEATNSSRRLFQTARELFEALDVAGRPVRLIGVRAEQLVAEGSDPAGLWSDDDGWRAVDSAVDELRERFGAEVAPARLLEGRGTVVDPRSLQDPQ